MHNPIQISELSLHYGDKLCFSDFSYTIYPGGKIAIIGDNGSGKSSLLKLIANIDNKVVEGIIYDPDIIHGYIPQIINDYTKLSGGQRFNKMLSEVLAISPELLLLDEPTNHLDLDNRKSLMRLLKNYYATQIIVSHDIELLDNCVDTLWHIHDRQISVYNGKYSDYRQQLLEDKQKLLTNITQLKQAKKEQHTALMKEQQRAKTSRAQGEKHIKERKWPTITSASKARRAETTSGKNSAYLSQVKAEITDQLDQLWQPEEISYSFTLTTNTVSKPVVTINDGECGYIGNSLLLQKINLNLFGGEKVALIGANGSGKSTLIKAIIEDKQIYTNGEWIIPSWADIAYVDQHYSNLPANMTVIEYIKILQPEFSHSELRNFLNQFLFRKNEEVNNLIGRLSGGERARLSLAAIAIRQPKLLILDEITNNIDMTTRDHIIQVLQSYPGAMLVICHDPDFLTAIQISHQYDVQLWQTGI